jgi:NAD(P)-dependent dehydrogenase (short-subunit alcohol dehydrogenase family)
MECYICKSRKWSSPEPQKGSPSSDLHLWTLENLSVPFKSLRFSFVNLAIEKAIHINMATSTPVFGKVIAVTGAASGIGLALSHLLASRGAIISMADLNESNLQKAAAEVQQKNSKAQVHSQVVDVRKTSSVDSWISNIVSQFGRLDGAANLAGVIGKSIGVKGIKDLEEDEWDFIIGVNLTGVMHCLRAQLKVMADGGSIINASSVAGLQGFKNNAAYAASKHGVLGLTRSAAKEAGERGIRVNAICPYAYSCLLVVLSIRADMLQGLH